MSNILEVEKTVAPEVQSAVMQQPAATVRYFGLDSLRAAAMLLGVFFHAVIMNGAFLTGPGAGFADWSHSFRMPLFFVLSGFFSYMLFARHGFLKYFLKRYWKIGAPLLIG